MWHLFSCPHSAVTSNETDQRTPPTTNRLDHFKPTATTARPSTVVTDTRLETATTADRSILATNNFDLKSIKFSPKVL